MVVICNIALKKKNVNSKNKKIRKFLTDMRKLKNGRAFIVKSGGGLPKSNFSPPYSVRFHTYLLYSIFKLKTGNPENILKADEPGRRLRVKGLSRRSGHLPEHGRGRSFEGFYGAKTGEVGFPADWDEQKMFLRY